MKKLATLLILAVMLVGPVAFAHEMENSAPMGDMGKSGMMKMYQCPMDGYTADKAGKCPKCGMEMKEKEMTADEAKAAMEKSK